MRAGFAADATDFWWTAGAAGAAAAFEGIGELYIYAWPPRPFTMRSSSARARRGDGRPHAGCCRCPHVADRSRGISALQGVRRRHHYTRAHAIPYLPRAFDAISTRWISKLVLQGPSGQSAELRSASPAVLTIRRIEFDALLVSLARAAGAELLESTEIHAASEDRDCVRLATRDGRTFSARMVVAADGVHGVIARRLGLLRGWRRDALAVDLMEETPTAELRATDPDALWVGYGFPASAAGGPDSLTAGYAYVFPKRAHVNVGLGYLSSEYRTAYRGPAYALQQGLIESLKRDGVLEGGSRSDASRRF